MNTNPTGKVDIEVDEYVLGILKLLGLYGKYLASDDPHKVLRAAWRQLWATPREFVQGLAVLGDFNFTLDLCAEAHTAKCSRYLGPGSDIAEDAFDVVWGTLLQGGHGWCNMPFNSIPRWVEGMMATGQHVMIAPDRTDQEWWHTLKRSSNCHETFVRGRPKFIPPAGVKDSGPAGGVAVWVIGHHERRLDECLDLAEILRVGRQACADIDGADGGSRE